MILLCLKNNISWQIFKQTYICMYNPCAHLALPLCPFFSFFDCLSIYSLIFFLHCRDLCSDPYIPCKFCRFWLCMCRWQRMLKCWVKRKCEIWKECHLFAQFTYPTLKIGEGVGLSSNRNLFRISFFSASSSIRFSRHKHIQAFKVRVIVHRQEKPLTCGRSACTENVTGTSSTKPYKDGCWLTFEEK